MRKNEQGSVLLVVLLMMTVFSIIGITIVGMAANNSKQIAHTGSGIKATNLAEMGVTHMKREAAKLIAKNKIASLSDTEKALRYKLPLINAFKVKKNKSYPLYKIEDVEITSSTLQGQEDIKITFTSIGLAEDQQESRISAELNISRGELDGRFPDPDNEMVVKDVDSINYRGPFNTPLLFTSHVEIPSNHDPVFIKDTYFMKGFTANSNTELKFESNLFLKGDSFIDSNSEVIVYGDTYIENIDVKQNKQENGNQGLLCIEGTLKIYGKVEGTVTTTSQSCGAIASAKHYGGIYAKKVIYYPKETQTPEWDVNRMLLDASYQ
ncbi:hypothetical protein M3204_05385 [Mesobacillus subterraneus]|uniref:hypothetical protein n=1 Tax=Mesobacillus subterraneus TaxID=285983 RepID=UPI00203C7900|nr:hypothetical protein [Mesobacillus subterraneus]MCM3663825.1 hypothetical protein [Mesobacillus subterraneus]MCM3683586.1 hypothetical protein [Mesobacillus subterraneus]